MSPESVPNSGMERLPSMLSEIESGISDGLHLGAQVYVSRNGEVVADAAVGWALNGVDMRPDSVNLWLSAGKPVTSVAIAMLRERGEIDIDSPGARYIPEFSVNGKDGITVRHVLTHTGGFLEAESADHLGSREEIIAAICESPIKGNWTPGERAAYQPTAGWHVLGEIVYRVTGRTVDELASEEILKPLNIADTSLKWEDRDRDALGNRWAPMHIVTEAGELEPYPSYSVAEMGSFARPGSSFRGPASGLGRLYELLLGGGTLDGVRLLDEESVSDMTARHREGLVDETFGMKMDWGLGLIPDNKRYGPAVPYGYGPQASESSYGHGGSQSSVGFADPDYGLAVAIVFNGMLGHPKHDRRMRRTLAALYEDLGLA